MALLQPPSFLQNRTDHTAQEDRLYLQGVLNPVGGVGGLAESAGVALVRAQASPNMTVLVAKERFFIPGTESTSQGMYHGYNDGDITVTIAASSPTLPRIDIICAYVQDQFYSGASNQLVVDKVTGTPAGSPVAPAPPANSITIAQIAVAANATTVTNVNITNTAQKCAANGGILPVSTQAIRDALGLFDGLSVYRKDTNNIETYNGSSWDIYPAGGPRGLLASVSRTNPSAAITTEAVLGSFSQISFTLATQRRVEWFINILFDTPSAANLSPTVNLRRNATGAVVGTGDTRIQLLRGFLTNAAAATQGWTAVGHGTELLAAGTYAYGVFAACSGGSMQLNAATDFPAQFRLYDMGAV